MKSATGGQYGRHPQRRRWFERQPLGETEVIAGTLEINGTLYCTSADIYACCTIQVGNGGASGSIFGNVVDNGTLEFDLISFVTYSGAICGSGSLVQARAGTLQLSGFDNTYLGGTILLAGILQVGTTGGYEYEPGGQELTYVLGTTIIAGQAHNGGSLTVNGGTLDLNGYYVEVARAQRQRRPDHELQHVVLGRPLRLPVRRDDIQAQISGRRTMVLV